MIFVDTGVWFAVAVRQDPNHVVASRLIGEATEELVTTAYVVDEALTLLRSRGYPAAAISVGRQLFENGVARIHHAERQDVSAAWEAFRRFADKDWSFTDCLSFVVMQRLGITTAFSFDHHFRQFGTVAVVP